MTVSLPVPAGAPHAGNHTDDTAATIVRPPKPRASVSSEICNARPPGPQLTVSSPPALLHAAEPAPLGVTIDGASEGAQVVICGLAATSVISAGGSLDETTWTLPASRLADATLTPPHEFVGPMQLTVVLVNLDRSVADRRTLHMKWESQTPTPPVAALAMPAPAPAATSAPSPPPSEKYDTAEVNKQVDEGKRLMVAGKLALARVILQEAAQSGDSRAAFLLAESYDPISLAKRQFQAPASDLEKARMWYRRAGDLGSPEANARLERLTNW
jgi:hypothetical protein